MLLSFLFIGCGLQVADLWFTSYRVVEFLSYKVVSCGLPWRPCSYGLLSIEVKCYRVFVLLCVSCVDFFIIPKENNTVNKYNKNRRLCIFLNLGNIVAGDIDFV